MRGLSPVVAGGGHSSSRCAGLSLSRPLLLRSTGSRCAGSVVVAHGPSCSAARGIPPDQGSNPCPLHWQADSQPLRHQGSPKYLLFNYVFQLLLIYEEYKQAKRKINKRYEYIFHRKGNMKRCLSPSTNRIANQDHSETLFHTHLIDKNQSLILLYIVEKLHPQDLIHCQRECTLESNLTFLLKLYFMTQQFLDGIQGKFLYLYKRRHNSNIHQSKNLDPI